MPEPSQPPEFRFSDCILSEDAYRWFSPSYRGMSSRTELLVMSLLFVVWRLLPSLWLHACFPIPAEVLDVLVDVLFFFPLFVRRARQMGLADYGYVLVAAYILPLLLDCYHHCVYGFCVDEYLGFLPYGILFLMLIPLYVCGGTFAGRKNELHRAAIAGDRERAERLLAYFPTGLTRTSEKGRTPLEYAREAGHKELASWFAQLEEAQRVAAEARAETAAE